jgi:xylan 1,4-beta-xylosidase
MASGPSTIFWYKANVTPPKDNAKWAGLITAFAKHVTERYGAEEIRSWYFEVWNEPNLVGFWIGTTGGKKYEEFAPTLRSEYYKLYETTAKALKEVDPTYRVGGPATAGSGWIDETLTYCADNHLPLDFVSTHCYATSSGYLDEHGNAGTIFSPDRNAVTDEVKGVRAKIDKSPFAKAELHYTEWSSSYTPHDPVHDNFQDAPFILNKIRHIGTAANSMSYWTFTDIFEEAGPRMTPIHGGFGLLNYQDLPKPAYFAYKFLNELGDTELVSQDPESFVCRDHAGNIQALFWDFTIANTGVKENDQKFFADDHPPKAKGSAELRLSGLTAGKYHLVAHRVGYRSNDVQTAWRDLGSPSQLTKAQVKQLHSATSDTPVIEESISVGADGAYSRSFPMRENDVWLVKLSPASS